jgi:adenylate cyclase
MERFINILIIDDDIKSQKALKEILSGSGNNVLTVNSIKHGLTVLARKEIGILLINIDSPLFTGLESLHTIQGASSVITVYKIALTENPTRGAKEVKSLSEGAVDYITKPFNPNLIRSKIDVFKSLYFKDQRIGQLLSNIFPKNVLHELNTYGKFAPKRVQNGVVLFTDFVDFSKKARKLNPLKLLKKLEYYFTQFDEIIARYKLEKIKTIGDSYMVLAGVTETTAEPVVRACLAALEIRQFMMNERYLATAMKRDFWEIRIGINMGPLVAGIIGTKKISFDVWGDTVNVASRAEQISWPGHITITESVAKHVEEYFELESRSKKEIVKHGGFIHLYFLEELKPEYCLYDEGIIASPELREKCGLTRMDFEHMSKDIINRLKSSLPDEIVYHNLPHALNVEKAAIRLATLEGIDEDELLILRTAVLYHDAGYILQYENNEIFAMTLAKNNLPKFGYSEEQIELVAKIILSTQEEHHPETLLEQIMCDADHDYFGRADYYSVSQKLREELVNFNQIFTDNEWIEFQLEYLENTHIFYTETAQNIRLTGKKHRIQELKNELIKIEISQEK